MLHLLRIIAAVAVLIVNMGAIVRSAHFCGDSSYRSTCPGNDQVEIRYPFWIDNRTVDEYGDCISYEGFQIKCAANGRPVINLSNDLYYVLSTDHYLEGGGGIRVVDVEIYEQKCPQPRRNFSIESMRFLHYYGSTDRTINMNIFYNCSRHPQNAVQHIPCLDNKKNTTTGQRSFAFFDQEISSDGFNWYENCEDAVVVPAANYEGADPTSLNYIRALKSGIDLFWDYPVNCGDCDRSGGNCWANETNQGVKGPFHCNCDGITRIDQICAGPYSDSKDRSDNDGKANGQRIVLGVSMGLGALLLSLIVLCRRKCYPLCNSVVSSCRKKIKGPTNVEVFLDNNYGCRSSQGYKYSEIKKMTNSFKDTLGQGGYGSVFKGKLYDGRLVAVKVLNESKGKGEDFINEVATIGKTNHVNVVSLLGFCAEGTKRALVYEFMPNGSLEKFIHNAKDSSTSSSFLGWEKLYQIALGIARGLEYLHRGCNTRILHFDIKPHNILLDQHFRPKISDFGLAKLCPTAESLVSMVGARGTPGYIAPEVYCGNFGGVSHKSDVYSYGMMVLEMVGGRKNLDILVENASQIYFPQWIYKRLRGNFKVEGSENLETVVVVGEVFEEKIVRKMLIVALWCIQAHPGDRPSMTKVVEMLEGNIEDLQLPPNPFPDPSSNSSSLP